MIEIIKCNLGRYGDFPIDMKYNSKNVISESVDRTILDSRQNSQEWPGGLGCFHGSGSGVEAGCLGSQGSLWQTQLVIYQ